MGIDSVLLRSIATVSVSMLSMFANAGVGEGQELYDAYCQICHGGVGEGQTMGKPLTDTVANRLTDEELIAVITDGREGTGMTAWRSSFTETEIFDIATYVRILQGKDGINLADDKAVPSDDKEVLAGESLFTGKAGCVTCHSYNDQGGIVGPSLDGVFARLGESGLNRALSNPSASIVTGYEAKEVVMEDGTLIRGRYRNDSDVAVQIQSADGRRWVTYFKDRVQLLNDSKESLMPDIYATFGATEQNQLMAFLKSL